MRKFAVLPPLTGVHCSVSINKSTLSMLFVILVLPSIDISNRPAVCAVSMLHVFSPTPRIYFPVGPCECPITVPLVVAKVPVIHTSRCKGICPKPVPLVTSPLPGINIPIIQGYRVTTTDIVAVSIATLLWQRDARMFCCCIDVMILMATSLGWQHVSAAAATNVTTATLRKKTIDFPALNFRVEQSSYNCSVFVCGKIQPAAPQFFSS